MDRKVCFKCGIEKDLSEFYKHAQMKDGYLNKCKECARKDVLENTFKNHEYYVAYDKKRALLPHRVKAREEYSKTEAYKKSHYESTVRTRIKYRDKYLARNKVRYAIKAGELNKPDFCSLCGCICIPEGHHEDYLKPLEVIWLCSACHHAVHKNVPF